ncbi:hypothetical protein CDAR_179651 [Caerostris darwini]|uniref:Uncharacterized protein n=1 Tax=Caerostris darwini TaxID=1538125 RepID=A0AAV4W6R9_9ARAC|nr:hypothetical protein CDAR_179651 [Caerostris darwini]
MFSTGHRLLLLPWTSTTIISHCFVRAPLLLSSSTASDCYPLLFRGTSLPSFSIAATFSTSSCNIFYFARFFSAGIIFYIVRLFLLPTFSTAVINFLCCSRLLFVGLLLSLSLTITISNIREFLHTVPPLLERSFSASGCHHLPLPRATFSTGNVFHCCQRLHLLPSSSIRATCATNVSQCCHHLTLLRASTSAAVIFHSFGLPSSSILRDFSPLIFHCCYLFHLFVRHLLLQPSSTLCDFLYCRHLLLPPSSSPAIVVFYCHRRLLLSPSSSTAFIFYCHHRLALLPSSFTATIVLPCYRLLLLPSSFTATIVLPCYRLLLLPSSSTTATVIFYCHPRLPLLPSFFTATIVFYCLALLPSSFTATIVFPCYRHLLLPASSCPVTICYFNLRARTISLCKSNDVLLLVLLAVCL